MAYDATITTEDEVDVMSGEQVDTTGATADRKAALVKQAESYLSALLKFDVTAGYAGLGTNLKLLFNEYGARYAAMQLIFFNTAAYTNGLIEAEDYVQLHVYRLEAIQKILKSQDTQDFLGTNS